MLTDKHINRLLNQNCTADHLTRFVLKWHSAEHIPTHIQHILVRLSEMKPTEQAEYYILNDELYHICQKRELYRRTDKHGWQKTSK